MLVLLVGCTPQGGGRLEQPSVHVAGPGEGSGTQVQSGDQVVEDAYVLRVTGEGQLDDPELQDELEALGAGELVPTAAPGTYRFESDAGLDEVALLVELGGVAWVEPVVRFYPQSADPDFSFAWHHPMLKTEAAWVHGRGAGAVVAVIDTGVLRVSELGVPNVDGIASLLPAREYVPVAPVTAEDGSQWAVPHDDVGHGTHVASTIAQRADNNVGSAGVAPEATILPIRALGQQGGDSTTLADAIRYATDQGAQVINMSWGSPLYAAVIDEACQYAADRGVVLVAAAGNDGSSRYLSYPAALDTVISVGAVGPDGFVADYSNRGPELDVVAPGGVYYDWDRNGLYDGVLAETWALWVGVQGVDDGAYVLDYFQVGTSMATATVSGVAALLVAQGADRDMVYEALTSTAADLGDPGVDTEYGHGLVDAAAAAALVAGLDPEEPHSTLTVEQLQPGDLVVTELMINPTCNNDDCEWLEVQNQTSSPVDLSGLHLEDASGNAGALDRSVLVAPGERVVLARGSDSIWTSYPVMLDVLPDAYYGTALSLNNTSDTVFLRNTSGEISRTLAYGSAQVVSGVSLSMVGADPADPASWVLTNTLVSGPLLFSGEWATPHAP
jgi:subtilisin family serine protease